jgi:hypothetical protein
MGKMLERLQPQMPPQTSSVTNGAVDSVDRSDFAKTWQATDSTVVSVETFVGTTASAGLDPASARQARPFALELAAVSLQATHYTVVLVVRHVVLGKHV